MTHLFQTEFVVTRIIVGVNCQAPVTTEGENRSLSDNTGAGHEKGAFYTHVETTDPRTATQQGILGHSRRVRRLFSTRLGLARSVADVSTWPPPPHRALGPIHRGEINFSQGPSADRDLQEALGH